jgi:RsiW-degrading membrane proteinase PrsW (M82 family)
LDNYLYNSPPSILNSPPLKVLSFDRLVVNIVRPIITSILLVYVRIRIINTIFSQKKMRIWITLKIFGLGIISVGSLLAYTYLLWFLWQENLALTKMINTENLLFFVAYCTAFVLLVIVFFRNRYKRIIQFLFIWWAIFVALAYGGFVIGINILILYYLVSAYAEEYMKYSASNNMFLSEKQANESNLIFFCILIGLWFSAVENIAYVINNILQSESINIIGLLIGRGLVSTLIHIVSTSLIAFIIIKTKRANNTIVPIILGIIGGFWLHSIYNISLQYNLSYVTIPIIIIAFFLMTYLTFQSDIIYKQQS